MGWNYTGIIIRDNKIRTVEITGSKDQLEITNIQTITSIEKISSLKNIITAIPGKGTTFRILDFPFRQKKKILQVLPSELEDSIPFQLNEVIYDFQFWEKNRKASKILVTIIKKEEYDNFTSTLIRSNLRPTKVGVEALYLSPLLQFVPEDADAGILDIEEKHSNLLLWGGEKRFFPRHLSIGNEQLNQLLEEKEESDQQEEALQAYTRLLAAEILQTLYSYRNKIGREIKKLYITGSGAIQENFINILHKTVGIKCEILKIPEFPPLPPGSNEIEFHLPLAIALNGPKGEFANEINFALPAEESEKEWEELKPILIPSIVLYLTLLLLLLIGTITKYSYVKSQYQKLRGEELQIVAQTIPEDAAYGDYVNSLQSKVQKLQQKISTTSNKSTYSVLDIIKEISANIPNTISITITDLTIDGKNLRIKGETSDFSTLDSIRQAISKVKELTNVSVVDSKKLQKSGNVSFTIVAKIGENNGTNSSQ